MQPYRSSNFRVSDPMETDLDIFKRSFSPDAFLTPNLATPRRVAPRRLFFHHINAADIFRS
jgi:hypothetical protein